MVEALYLHANHPFFALVVPFKSLQLVALHCSEGVHDVCAEERVDVLREVLGRSLSVLGPVGVVADTFVGLGLYLRFHHQDGAVGMTTDGRVGCGERGGMRMYVRISRNGKKIGPTIGSRGDFSQWFNCFYLCLKI